MPYQPTFAVLVLYSKRSGFNRFLLESFPMKRLQLWARDTHTLQPVSHSLPFLQISVTVRFD
jgi:hypothetical protein